MQKLEGYYIRHENKTVDVPAYELDNGDHFITDQDAEELTYVKDFIGRFSNFWKRDEALVGWRGTPDVQTK
jgi:hypothetical protein